MAFFDKLGKKASEAYKITADKTERLAKETKIKFKISDLKSQINDVYEEIGKKVYEKHIQKEEFTINDAEEQCTKIDFLTDEIEGLLKQSLELKDKKQCKNCFREIEKEAKFCPNCGAEQENDNDLKECELVDDIEVQEKEEIESEEDEKIENQIEIDQVKEQEENNEIKNEEASNLQKTIQIESNVENDNNNENDENK